MNYDKSLIIKSKDDGSFTCSMVLNDETIIVKILNRKSIEQLYTDIEELLKEDT